MQQTSSTVVVSNIFDEVRVFLNCLGDRDARMRFLAGIPSNILDKPEAIRVCEQFNGLEPGTLEHFGEDSSDIFHPFLDLYIAGLLGVVEYDPEMGINVVDLGLIYDVSVTEADGKSNVNVKMTMTSPACPFAPQIVREHFGLGDRMIPLGAVAVGVPAQPAKDRPPRRAENYIIPVD